MSGLALLVSSQLLAAAAPDASQASDGWSPAAAHDEIRPDFEFKPPGRLILRADQREGLAGHWEKRCAVVGGQCYRFRALRLVDNVASPRRSALARILWRDAEGRPVHHDAPGARSFAPDKPPLAEPEYPSDGATDAAGWTEISGVYRAPSKATQAIVVEPGRFPVRDSETSAGVEGRMRNPKPEIRNPKEARNPKSESAGPSMTASGFGLRISFGFRISDFGFRLCARHLIS